MKAEEKLFRLLLSITESGDFINNEIHILKSEKDGDIKFRVYHQKGYCYDSDKNTFSQNWEGFKQIESIEKAISMTSVSVQMD